MEPGLPSLATEAGGGFAPGFVERKAQTQHRKLASSWEESPHSKESEQQDNIK